jgi:hypothetical protein
MQDFSSGLQESDNTFYSRADVVEADPEVKKEKKSFLLSLRFT